MKRTDLNWVKFHQLEIEEGFNIREDYGDIESLCASIIENGVKSPLSGKKKRGEDVFIVTDGHRRYRALKMVVAKGYTDILIPILPDKSKTEEARLFSQFILNDGKPLSVLEQSLLYSRLRDYGYNATDIAKKVGKSATHISDCFSLADAPKSLLDKVRGGQVAPSLVIEQLKSSDAEKVDAALDKALAKTKKKKVSKKHVGGQKNKSVKVDDMQKLYEQIAEIDLDEETPAKADVAKMDTFHLIIKYYQEQIDFSELLKHFEA